MGRHAAAKAPHPPTNRSRVSNLNAVLPGVDGRTQIARRYHDISYAIFTDQGGIDRCSEARVQLIRRFAAAAVMAEQMEACLANGAQVDIMEHAQLTSTMVRVAQRIGINRRTKNITPSLSQYLERADIEEEIKDEHRPDD